MENARRGMHVTGLKSACMGCVLACLVAAPAAIAASKPAPASMRVVANDGFPPYLFLDADGRPRGYDVDMWRLFAQYTGIKVDLAPMRWSAATAALQAGRADVIDSIYRTPARDARYDFSPSYDSVPIGIYVDRRIRGVHDVASLRGFPVAVERGDACSERLAARGVTDLQTYAGYRDLIDAAARGDVRIFCMAEGPADYYLYRNAALNRFSESFVLFDGQLHWAVRKGNAALLAVVERGMASIPAAAREQVRRRWLAQPVALWPWLRAGKIALAAVLLLAALAAAWVWSLRRTVTRRTRDLRAEQGKLRALFEASPDAMWVKDLQGIYRECNDRVFEILHLERKQLIGRSDTELFGPDILPGVLASDAATAASGRPHTDVLTVGADTGRPRQLEVIKVPLFAADGTLYGTLGTARDITKRVATEAQLRLWAHAYDHAAFGVAIFDARTRTISAVNPTFASERGYAPEEMVGMSVNVLYPEELVAEREQARVEIDKLDHSLIETEQLTRDGRRFPVLLDISVLRAADGTPQRVFVYSQDITARRQAETELRLAAIAFQTQEALLVADADGIIRRVNKAFTRLTGYTPGEALGQSPALLALKRDGQSFGPQVWEEARRAGVWRGEQWIETRHGQPKVVRTTISIVMTAGGKLTHFICSMIDMTSEREAHASVDHMTFFDPLTDLPNRYFLRGRLQHLLDNPESGGGVLLLVDLDRFKHVNDLRGHSAGDALLVLVSQRLRPLLDDDCALGRLGGGTFGLLAECRSADPETRAALGRNWAERIREALREPFRLGTGAPVAVTASIGWTELMPGQGSPEAVHKEAEMAMYDAKTAGRDQARRFEPSMQVDLERREALIQDLRDAIAGNSLEIHLQSQVDRAGRVTGAETLLRWTRPNGESVSPATFIPIAEDSGLILPLGDWVLRRSCAQLAAWSTHAATRDLTLAVNVSARQFAEPGFIESVRRALALTRANPELLKLEITESAIIGDLDEIASKLARLRTHGIRISLDDFGTGYSSLAYLSRLPLDQLKIDKSFVARLPHDANDAMVAQTILAMGRGLGMEVLAEGVETLAQRDFLTAFGCDAFQGYVFSRPVTVAEFEATLMPAPTPA